MVGWSWSDCHVQLCKNYANRNCIEKSIYELGEEDKSRPAHAAVYGRWGYGFVMKKLHQLCKCNNACKVRAHPRLSFLNWCALLLFVSCLYAQGIDRMFSFSSWLRPYLIYCITCHFHSIRLYIMNYNCGLVQVILWIKSAYSESIFKIVGGFSI